MKTPVKLAAFAAVLGLVFAGTYAVGALAGPAGSSGTNAHGADAHSTDGHGANGDGSHGDASNEAEAASGPAGLAVSADGYTLRQTGPTPITGQDGEFTFQILDTAGVPVTGFQTSHDKPLHLIVVRRDATGFQHLHPTMAADGTWRTPMRLPAAGDWRAFADFVPTAHGRQVVLGLDMAASGLYEPQPLPPPATTATVDGYTVTVDGALTAGRTSRLTLTVAKEGAAVTDLQPYLGAYGHLVALRVGDLGYLHVHPQQTDTAGPAIAFDVEIPTGGAYRLFLDFQHGGVVRTAAFTTTAA